jgi:hypothetical protein
LPACGGAHFGKIDHLALRCDSIAPYSERLARCGLAFIELDAPHIGSAPRIRQPPQPPDRVAA